EVISDLADFTRKQSSFIFPATSGTIGMTDIKYFIHSCMECCGFKCIDDFIDQGKNDFMYFWMEGAIAFTIKAVFIRPLIFSRHFYSRRFIKLRINLQQFISSVSPGLVSQKINLWY